MLDLGWEEEGWAGLSHSCKQVSGVSTAQLLAWCAADTWYPITDVEQAGVSPEAPPHLWAPAEGRGLMTGTDALFRTRTGQSPVSILVASPFCRRLLCTPSEDTMGDGTLAALYRPRPIRATSTRAPALTPLHILHPNLWFLTSVCCCPMPFLCGSLLGPWVLTWSQPRSSLCGVYCRDPAAGGGGAGGAQGRREGLCGAPRPGLQGCD